MSYAPLDRGTPEPVTPEPATPAPLDRGTLTINTHPWSEVYIDGSFLGRTPLINAELPVGIDKLRMVYPSRGGIETTQAVKIKSGMNTKVVRRLPEK